MRLVHAIVNYKLLPNVRVNSYSILFTADDISILVGYQNTVSFLRAFKKWTGMTVTQFREKSRKQMLD